jgi:hypothetical protein
VAEILYRVEYWVPGVEMGTIYLPPMPIGDALRECRELKKVGFVARFRMLTTAEKGA